MSCEIAAVRAHAGPLHELNVTNLGSILPETLSVEDGLLKKKMASLVGFTPDTCANYQIIGTRTVHKRVTLR
jgi:hypothetical protein